MYMYTCTCVCLQVSIKLHAKYTTDYPDSPPDLQLIDAQCLSEDLVKDLLKEINELAQERVGEVSIRGFHNFHMGFLLDGGKLNTVLLIRVIFLW